MSFSVTGVLYTARNVPCSSGDWQTHHGRVLDQQVFAMHKHKDVTWPVDTQSRLKINVGAMVTFKPFSPAVKSPTNDWRLHDLSKPGMHLCSVGTLAAHSAHFKLTHT